MTKIIICRDDARLGFEFRSLQSGQSLFVMRRNVTRGERPRLFCLFLSYANVDPPELLSLSLGTDPG